MKRTLLLWLALLCAPLAAQEIGRGEVLRVATRDGVSVPIYAYWRDAALATVVLFSGGGGGYGKIADDGWPASGNFLIRTGKLWASQPFNVVMVGRPSDGIDLALGIVRVGDEHAADNVAVFKAVKQKSAAPLWVVGTSMGTISATAAAIRDREQFDRWRRADLVDRRLQDSRRGQQAGARNDPCAGAGAASRKRRPARPADLTRP